MKKILFILMLLVTIPSMVFAGNAVPYSDEALQNVIKAISENSKEGYETRTEFCSQQDSKPLETEEKAQCG